MNAQSVNSNRNRSMEDNNSETRLKEGGHKKEGDDEKVSPPYSATSTLDSSHNNSQSSSESKPPHSKAATSASGGPTKEDDLPSSSSSASRAVQISSLYSSMKLPIGCLREQDGCDVAELRARAKRCQEIMNLCEQEKKAEAERIRIANIKPLVWAKPTFELGSDAKADTADDTTAADETKAEEEETTTQAADDTSGKRKGHQDETTSTIQHYSPYHRERLFYKRRRESTPEEVQAFVEFANKWIPSRRTSDLTVENDDKEETKGKETKSEGASSSS